MGKQITFQAGGKAFSFSLKKYVAFEVAGHIFTIGAGAVIGAIFGHPFIGAAAGVAVGAVSEVAEYVFVKKAIQKGILKISVQ